MFRARTWKRLAITLIVLFVAVLVGGKWLLRSAYAIDQVRARLGAAAGAPVRVASVDLGFLASRLEGVEVDQARDSPNTPPWLTIRSIDAGLSLAQLILGNSGDGIVTLRDLHVILAFDSEDRLLTRLPTPAEGEGSMPLVRIEGGTFTLKRLGRPDEVFHNINLEFQIRGEMLLLSGTIDDPEWGPWTVTGSRESPTAPFALNLKTREIVHVSPALLQRTPFVGAHVWRTVSCEGDTPCELALLFKPAPAINYRIELEPRNTTVYVPCIDLRAEGAQGKVVIADDVLTLENVRGQSAGGNLKLRSLMDFRGPISQLNFSVEAGLLGLNRLPKSWGVPPLQGELTGKADLHVAIRDGRARTSGQGRGSVRVFPLLRPIDVFLSADERGLRFNLARR